MRNQSSGREGKLERGLGRVAIGIRSACDCAGKLVRYFAHQNFWKQVADSAQCMPLGFVGYPVRVSGQNLQRLYNVRRDYKVS